MKLIFSFILVSLLSIGCMSTEKTTALMETTGAVLSEYNTIATELEGVVDLLISKNPDSVELVGMKEDLQTSMKNVAALGTQIKNLLESTSLTPVQQAEILSILDLILDKVGEGE